MARALSDLWSDPNTDALAATWRACRSPAGKGWSLAAFCSPHRLGTICPWHSTLHQPQPAVRFSKRAKLAKHQPLPSSSAQLVFCRRQISLPSLACSQVESLCYNQVIGFGELGPQRGRTPAQWYWWAQQGAVARGLKMSLRIDAELWQEREPSGILGGLRGDGQGEKSPPWEVAAGSYEALPPSALPTSALLLAL